MLSCWQQWEDSLMRSRFDRMQTRKGRLKVPIAARKTKRGIHWMSHMPGVRAGKRTSQGHWNQLNTDMERRIPSPLLDVEAERKTGKRETSVVDRTVALIREAALRLMLTKPAETARTDQQPGNRQGRKRLMPR